MATPVFNSDEVQKSINEHAFAELVKLVSCLPLRFGEVLSQELFQDSWKCLRAFPQFDVPKFVRRNHLDERWVDRWRNTRREGNEAKGYFDTEDLPSANVTVYFLMMAVVSLDERLQPRYTRHPIFTEVAKQKREQEVVRQGALEHPLEILPAIGEEFAKVTTMPDGRPWDTPLADDPEYLKCVPVRGQKTLGSRSIITFGQLVVTTEADLLRLGYFGRKSLNQVRTFLEQKGLSLGMVINE